MPGRRTTTIPVGCGPSLLGSIALPRYGWQSIQTWGVPSDAKRRLLRDNDDSPRNGQIMAQRSSFPPTGFLILGVLNIVASILFAVRAAVVEPTAERVWSALLFGAFGIFWLGAYWSTRRPSAE